ncbi:unnamed protein product [Bursaphelenchus xylophilus]|uniref:Histone acetyltransferase type B catalytic subunit n=1 Tax=Bursaphelenchus xylophilus TaxID=6326 RepID=A0A1I7SAE1_BURXY|nr:unnamed protein product [Bursaphelenchus xylophilus]CAG9084010.1 unnamed protein product [Bursaphelenchus xylophilus]
MFKQESSNQKFAPYVSDALECVKLKFVDNNCDIVNAAQYDIDFAYQHFDQAEKIVGFKDLEVNVVYSNLTMYSYVKVDHTGDITEVDNTIEPDDIVTLIRNQYPIGQTNSLITNVASFKALCERQKEFVPFGKKVADLEWRNKKYELYRVTFDDRKQGFDQYLARVQTLSLYFIESASYTDPEDPRFTYYFIYEKEPTMALAGYVCLYNFYHYPDKERPRFAQALVLPPYRRSGLGNKFLEMVYDDLRRDEKVFDITAETPADTFIYSRDFLDCKLMKPMEEFGFEVLKKGYSKELEDKMREKTKIGKVQARRVYELLRYFYVQTSHPEDEESFENDVRKRIAIPFNKSSRDSSKLRTVLTDQELAIVSAKDNPEEKKKMIDAIYESTVEQYGIVLDRLTKYESVLFPKS